MKIVYFFLLIFSLSFSQNKISKSDIIGKWEVKVKVKQLLKEEVKNLDMLEKMAVELASGFAEDIIDSADIYVLFKENNTALITVDFLDYEEQEEIKWFIEDNEIVIDDTLNKKINMGSENNKWALEDEVLFLKEKNQKLNKNIFLKKVL
jgi:hypothetical protein|tara:strand:- start:1920 stop:2369 length:450 start_codon:yes stop_codon:yes gene_type:complete